MKILIAEDQKEISSVMKKYFTSEGYEVEVANNGLEALQCFHSEEFQLCIFDIMMPGMNGFEVIQEVRKGSNVPIIIVSAKISEEDRLRGFQLGIDDYVTKPFSMKELVYRVKSLVKRVYQTYEVLRYEDLTVDTKAKVICKNGNELPFTNTEYRIMYTFFTHLNQVLTREQLITSTFTHDYEGYDRTIDTHIKRIRQKLEKDQKHPKYLHTKYGMGYLFGKGNS